ncbi:MAG TPA: RagB/SusD family nutrient uptake outer membrane protein [Puia sp.]|jgi:hypothetical protein
MRKIYYLSLLSSGMLLILGGCRKFVQIPPPPDSLISSQLFGDSSDAVAALSGIYINVLQNTNTINASSGLLTLYPGMTADELAPPFPGSDAAYAANNIIETDQTLESIWSQCYNDIYRANACIEGAAASNGISGSLKARITGEAKFFRAFYHLNLTNVFGGVPLVQSTDYNVNAKLARSGVPDIYQAVIADLNSADSLLSGSGLDNIPSRVNHYAVEALLARVYLYNKQYDKADEYATKVLAGGYSLPADPNQVFLIGSSEAILQILPTYPGDETAEGNIFLPYDPSSPFPPNYMLDSGLVNAFEPDDLRKDAWVSSLTAGSDVYYYPTKYKLRSDFSSTAPPTEGYMWLRLAEQYLIRAEARAQQGDVSGALSDLDAIRERAGLTDAVAGSAADVQAAIQKERRIELFCEWGHRWIDLKRTGTIDAVLGKEKTGWAPSDALWPIPYNEIRTNPFLTPNPS